jgi:hypothetical protein
MPTHLEQVYGFAIAKSENIGIDTHRYQPNECIVEMIKQIEDR